MDKLTLNDDIITSFKYDMINGNLKGIKIAGGNYIKISQLPIKTRVYWNSRFDRNSAKLLNESNRGARILQYSKDGVPLTYKNYFIWTEADLSDVDTWLEWQRELVIEVSGLGGEVTYDVANPASEIRVESLQQISIIRALENLGTSNNRVDAGKWANEILENSINNELNTRNITEVNSNLLRLNYTNEIISDKITGEIALMDSINNGIMEITSQQIKSQNNENTIINQNENIKDKLTQGNLNTLNISGLTGQIKNLIVNTNDNLNTINEKISDFKNSSNEKLDDINNSLNNNMAQEATLQTANTNLELIADKIETTNTNQGTILEKIQASNDALSNIETEQRLLNLESTQKQILTEMTTVNIQLNNIHSALQGGSGGEYIPSDLELNVEPYTYYTNLQNATNQQKISQYSKRIDYWLSPNKKVSFLRETNCTSLNIPAANQSSMVFNFTTNYLVKLKMLFQLTYDFERGNLAQPTFNDEQYRFITSVMESSTWTEIINKNSSYNAPNLTRYSLDNGLVTFTTANRANNLVCYNTIYLEYETSGFMGDIYEFNIYSNFIKCSLPYVTLPSGITPNNLGNFINIRELSGNIEVAKVIRPNITRPNITRPDITTPDITTPDVWNY